MPNLIPSSRAEALASGAPRYFTGKPCKHGHVAERFAYGVCTECDKAWNKLRTKLVKGSPEEKERCRLKAIRQREENPEKLNERTRKWRKLNPEQRKRYRQDRLALYAAHAAKRRAAELDRTPIWADDRQIQAVYEEAARMSREIGIEMQVDHVIPLQGEIVSGLHIHSNLQIIPAIVNQKKNNHFEVAA